MADDDKPEPPRDPRPEDDPESSTGTKPFFGTHPIAPERQAGMDAAHDEINEAIAAYDALLDHFAGLGAEPTEADHQWAKQVSPNNDN